MIKEIKIEMMIMMIDLVMMRITDGTGGRKMDGRTDGVTKSPS